MGFSLFGGRKKAYAAAARELGLEFSDAGDENAFRAFASEIPVDANAVFAEFLTAQGPLDPRVHDTLKARFAAVLAKFGLHRTALRVFNLGKGKFDPAITSVFSGKLNGRDVAIFDYSFRKSAMSVDEPIVTQTIAAFRFPGRTLAATNAQRSQYTVETGGDCLIVYTPNREVAPEKIPAFAREAAAIAATLA